MCSVLRLIGLGTEPNRILRFLRIRNQNSRFQFGSALVLNFLVRSSVLGFFVPRATLSLYFLSTCRACNADALSGKCFFLKYWRTAAHHNAFASIIQSQNHNKAALRVSGSRIKNNNQQFSKRNHPRSFKKEGQEKTANVPDAQSLWSCDWRINWHQIWCDNKNKSETSTWQIHFKISKAQSLWTHLFDHANHSSPQCLLVLESWTYPCLFAKKK